MLTDNVNVSAELAQLLAKQAPETYDFNGGAVKVATTPPSPAPQQAAPETPEPEAPVDEAPPKADPFGDRFNKLAEAQRRLKADREAAKAEQSKFQADMEELRQLRELKARAKEDPVAWAEAGGYKAPDEYATSLMEKGSMSPERRRILELQKETNELKSWKQQQEERAKQSELQSAQQTIMNEVQSAARDAGERFDLVNRTGSYPQVLQEIQEHFNTTKDPETGMGEVLSFEDALERVEERLVALYSPLLESNKLRSKLGINSSAPTSGAPASRKPSATITNKMAGNSSSTPRAMSEQERMAAAGDFFLKQLRGQR